jgi:hypothetical protein
MCPPTRGGTGPALSPSALFPHAGAAPRPARPPWPATARPRPGPPPTQHPAPTAQADQAPRRPTRPAPLLGHPTGTDHRRAVHPVPLGRLPLSGLPGHDRHPHLVLLARRQPPAWLLPDTPEADIINSLQIGQTRRSMAGYFTPDLLHELRRKTATCMYVSGRRAWCRRLLQGLFPVALVPRMHCRMEDRTFSLGFHPS